MTREEQDKIWALLSEEKKKEYRKEFQEESESHHQSVKHCDRENEFEYNTGYSNGVISTLEELFGSHNLQPKLTYEDVARELFENKEFFIYDSENNVIVPELRPLNKPINCTSRKQAEKLLAINKLLNVAKFLNKNADGTDWVPDWEKVYEEVEKIYGIGIDPFAYYEVKVFQVNPERIITEIVYFRTETIAKQCVEILGEETIIIALGNY